MCGLTTLAAEGIMYQLVIQRAGVEKPTTSNNPSVIASEAYLQRVAVPTCPGWVSVSASAWSWPELLQRLSWLGLCSKPSSECSPSQVDESQ